MSIVNIFEEKLESELGKIGLGIDDVEKYETIGNNLVLYLKNGYQVKINNPYLAKLAKAKTNEEIITECISKKSLLARLYMLENIFIGKRKWEDFLKKYASYTPRELFQRIRELEEKNSEYLHRLKEYAKVLIASIIVNNGPYYPTGIDELLSKKTNQELAEIYVKLSNGEISGRDLRNLVQKTKKTRKL